MLIGLLEMSASTVATMVVTVCLMRYFRTESRSLNAAVSGFLWIVVVTGTVFPFGCAGSLRPGAITAVTTATALISQ